MDCFGLQKFLKRTCCSCGSGDSTASDKVQITKISKRKSSAGDTTLKGKSTKELPIIGNDNPAYHNDDAQDKIASKSIGDKVVNDQPRLEKSYAYERQVSDVSNFSDFPPPSGKGLTEMVMEEIERSFASERDVQELEKSFQGRQTTHDENEVTAHPHLISGIPDSQEISKDSYKDLKISRPEVELTVDVSPTSNSQNDEVPSSEVELTPDISPPTIGQNDAVSPSEVELPVVMSSPLESQTDDVPLPEVDLPTDSLPLSDDLKDDKIFTNEIKLPADLSPHPGGQIDHKILAPEVDPPTDTTTQTQSSESPVVSKELEWRQKLMDDLDDDEEFLSSSDEEDAGISQQDICDNDDDITHDRPFSESDDMDVDHNTKNTNGISRGNSESSGIIKCCGDPVVVDMGSYEIKAGIAGEYEPSHVFRNVLGKWRPQVGEAYSEAYGEILYGDDALTKHNALSLHYTFQDGVVTDWKNFESICDWTLSSCLDVDIKDHPLLLTEPALVSKSQREKQLEVVMEALHCPMVQFRSQEALSALYAGKDVALVVNSGHTCTEVVPIYYGYPIVNAIQQVRIGGQHVTEYLGRLLLRERGINFSSVADLLLLDSLKLSYAEIISDENFLESSRNKTIQHELPDGGILELGSEVYECTQPLYNPQLLGHEGPGLYEAMKQSLKSLDSDIRGDMKSSVLLTGGNSGLRGFKSQLSEKLRSKDKKKENTKSKSWSIEEADNILHSTWIGGSVYADRDDFRDSCITDDMYFEFGQSIVHRMSF